MANIKFITTAKEEVRVIAAGGSLMQAAVGAGVDGIDADCGGVCSCATCHVRIPPEWVAVVGEPNDIERETLLLEARVGKHSRLSCQIQVTEALEGLWVEVVGR